MSNDAEGREVPDAVILAEDTGDRNDLDETGDDARPGAVGAETIVVEPVPADELAAGDDTPDEPVVADGAAAGPGLADDTVAGPGLADDTAAEPGLADDTVAEPGAGGATAADAVAASSSASPKHAAADSGPARPGMAVDGDVPPGTPMAGDPEQLHQRWAAIQTSFVDDPRGSVTSAADLVTEVIATVVASAKERESGLRGEWDRDDVDTEGLRNALRNYRALLDQLAAL